MLRAVNQGRPCRGGRGARGQPSTRARQERRGPEGERAQRPRRAGTGRGASAPPSPRSVTSGFRNSVRSTTSAASSERGEGRARGGIACGSSWGRHYRIALVNGRAEPRRAPGGAQPLDGPYVLLTFRHPEVAQQARAGPVRDDQGRHLRRAAAAPPVLDPRRRPRRGTPSRLFLKAVGRGQPRPGRPARGRGRAVPRPAGPAVHRRRPPARRRCWSPAATASRPSTSSAQELGRAGRERARLLRRPHRGRPAAPRRLRRRWACPLVAATDDGSLGHHGRVTEPLEAHLDARPGPVQLYACGPDAMLHAVARLAARRGLPAQVSLDPWMGCGVGTCLGCVVLDPAARTRRGRTTAAPARRARCSTRARWCGRARRVARARRAAAPWRRPPHEPRRRGRRAAPQEPAHRRLRHLRLRRRVRGHPRPLARWAASSPRASTSSRATAAPRRASWRRRPGLLNAIGLQGVGVRAFVERRAARARPATTPPCSSTSAATPSTSTPRSRASSTDGAGRGRARDQHLLPQREEGRDGLRRRPADDPRGGGRGAQGHAPARDPQALAQRRRHHASSRAWRRRRAPTRSPASTRCSAWPWTWSGAGPRLAFGTGGLSGPAIRPIAVRMAWQAARAVKIPVIGIGGIASRGGRARVPHRGLPRGADRHRQLRRPRRLRPRSWPASTPTCGGTASTTSTTWWARSTSRRAARRGGAGE